MASLQELAVQHEQNYNETPDDTPLRVIEGEIDEDVADERDSSKTISLLQSEQG